MLLGTSKSPDGTVTVCVDGTDYSIETVPHSLLSAENVDWILKAHPEATKHMPDVALLRAAKGQGPDPKH